MKNEAIVIRTSLSINCCFKTILNFFQSAENKTGDALSPIARLSERGHLEMNMAQSMLHKKRLFQRACYKNSAVS